MPSLSSRLNSCLQSVKARYHPLWRIRRTPWLNAALARMDFPVRARNPHLASGMYVYWYQNLSWLVSRGIQEPEVQKTLAAFAFLCSEGAYWDVGANIGYHAWSVQALAQPPEVLLIEPVPANLRLLRRTIRKNRLPNVEIVPCAVSDADGRAALRVDDKSGAASQLDTIYQEGSKTAIAHTYGSTKTISVEIRTLDSILGTRPIPPALIKIDVEDAEVLTLRGATRLLSSVRPVIVLECFKGEALDLLRRHQYGLRRIDAFANFLAYPREREPVLREALARAGGTEI